MLLLIIGLGGVQRHRGHGADGLADLILSKGKSGVVELIAPAVEGLEGLSIGSHHGASRVIDDADVLCPALSDHGKLAAGDDDALSIDHAHRAIRVLLELQDYILKNSPRHSRPPHSEFIKILCANCQCLYYIGIFVGLQDVFSLFNKKIDCFLSNI